MVYRGISVFLGAALLGAALASKLHAEELTLGSLTALTGYSAKQGVVCKDLFQIALNEHIEQDLPSEQSIRLVFGDSQRKAGPTLSEFSRMSSVDTISAVVLSGSPVGMALNPLSKRKAIPILGAVGHKDFLPQNPYAFGIWPSTIAEGAATAKRIIADKHQRIAVVTAEDEWNLSLEEGFLEALKQSNAQVVFDEDVIRAEQDFASLVLRLKQSNPDAVFVNVVLGNSGVLIKKLRELGVEAKIYANYFAATEAELASAGDAAVGVIGTQVQYDTEALRALLARHGFPEADPNTIAFTCLATMELVLQSVAAAKTPVSNSKQLFEALLDTDSVNVLGTKIRINERRAEFDFRYQEYDGSGWKPVSTGH